MTCSLEQKTKFESKQLNLVISSSHDLGSLNQVDTHSVRTRQRIIRLHLAQDYKSKLSHSGLIR